MDGDKVISLSSDDLATDPSHSTHHTAQLPLKQQRLCYQLLSAAIAWEVFEIAVRSEVAILRIHNSSSVS